jgi:hypothetical protein
MDAVWTQHDMDAAAQARTVLYAVRCRLAGWGDKLSDWTNDAGNSIRPARLQAGLPTRTSILAFLIVILLCSPRLSHSFNHHRRRTSLTTSSSVSPLLPPPPPSPPRPMPGPSGGGNAPATANPITAGANPRRRARGSRHGSRVGSANGADRGAGGASASASASASATVSASASTDTLTHLASRTSAQLVQ